MNRFKATHFVLQMTTIFKCKTSEAYQIKVLAELLSNNLTTGCFEVTNDGITLRMFDKPKRTLVDLVLEADNFSPYRFKLDEKFWLGLNLHHFHRMLKSIKKKDSLQLAIKSDNLNGLDIRTIPKEHTRMTTSSIRIQNVQNVEVDVPSGYGRPIIVPSPDFQKMCKELSSIGSTNICVESRNFYMDFIADADNILKRRVRLGETDFSDNESDEEESGVAIYSATFSADQFTRISKIAGLHTSMQIFPGSEDRPILFRSGVGTLGRISIYIKSKELLERELDQSESDDSDYE
jgi:proliferating cell nuclear antigen PCNA